MKTRLFLCFLLLVLSLQARQAMMNVPARQGMSLDGKWNYIIDPYDAGYFDYRYQPFDQAPEPTGGFFLDRQPKDKTELAEYDFDRSPTLIVPRDWNSQDDKLLYYEGTVWYRRLFDFRKSVPAARLFICFGAANYEADVYLNGRKLGQHIGGFTPFAFEITDVVKETGNSLVVRVNNQRHREGVPTLNTDWWNYGGLTRDVALVETPETFVADYSVRLKQGTRNVIEVKIQLDGPHKRQAVKVDIPELKITAETMADEAGRANIEFPVDHLTLWSPENPKRYQVTVSSGTDRVADQIGFRSIEVRGTDILLNGRPVFLRGISIHEEDPLRGRRAGSEEEARMLLTWAKELNCNFVRLAHYPHSEYMARLADQMGIMVWEEIPVYWTILWDNPATLENARSQLTELIERDRNRASVIIWSVANETPVGEARNRFLENLIDLARSLDGTRLVSAAMETHGVPGDPDTRMVDDPLGEYTDLISFNEYVGWYDGLPDRCGRIRWSIKYQKPVVISEFGGGALQGFHADKLTRFSEEFQEDLYRQTLPMLQRIPQFRGVTPWILCDFRSPRRLLPNIQDGWNRKGLIGENGIKKKAFYVLKAFYDQMEKPND
jgi:beta-glucuronidase